jgi:predicted transcriptional regulator of viral defense system
LPAPDSTTKLLRLISRSGVLRPRDLAGTGLTRQLLDRLVQRGLVERVGRGLYARAGTRPGEYRSLAEAAKRVPHGVVCLLSALAYHGLTTQSPHEVWLAIDSATRWPRIDHPPVKRIRMSRAAHRHGIEHHRLDGVSVPIYSIAKTVADGFKYRRRIGADVAVEALREALAERRVDRDALWRAARVCRVTRVMRPYLEALG